MMWTDELTLEWIAHLTPGDARTTAFLNQARTALIRLGEAREHIAQTRADFLALGDVIKDLPNANDAMRELGIVLETIGAAAALLDKGLHR